MKGRRKNVSQRRRIKTASLMESRDRVSRGFTPDVPGVPKKTRVKLYFRLMFQLEEEFYQRLAREE